MPPKRKRVTNSKPSPSKRRRRNRDSEDDDDDDFEDDKQRHEFGAPSKDDDQPAVSTAASIATHATRTPRILTVSGLTTLAMRVAAKNVQVLFGYKHQKRTTRLLGEVPPHLVSRLFGHFRTQHPELLSHTMITETHIAVHSTSLRGPEVILTGDLPGVGPKTIAGLSKHASNDLRVLELSGLDTAALSDATTKTDLFDNMRELETLILRDSKGVGHDLISAAANRCRRLKHVNLNYTQATTESVLSLITKCTRLETLKLAGITHLSKTGIRPILAFVKDAAEKIDGDAEPALGPIANLKLRSVHVAPDVVYRNFISFFSHLRRLDISHSNIAFNLALIGSQAPALEKLNIKHTPTTGADLIAVLPLFPKLHALDIGALGMGGKGSVTMITSSMFSITPVVLRGVTAILAGFERLEKLSLAVSVALTGRERLELDQPSAVQDFIRVVGRRCKYLDMSDITLKGTDFLYLVPDSDRIDPSLSTASNLEHLRLSNTKLDDSVCDFIASCTNLKILDLEATLISTDGVFRILDRCEDLHSINLTGCRRVRLQDRRRIFEAWGRAAAKVLISK